MFPQTFTLKNNQTLILKEAEEKNAEEIIKYVKQVLGETNYLTINPDEFNMTVEEEKKFINNQKSSKNKLFLIGIIENQIISVVTLTSNNKIRQRHVGTFGITVKKDFWNLGIGNLMIKATIKYAKSSKIIRKINLKVNTENEKAIKLYKKHGFKIEGTHSRDSQINEQFKSSHSMGLEID